MLLEAYGKCIGVTQSHGSHLAVVAIALCVPNEAIKLLVPSSNHRSLHCYETKESLKAASLDQTSLPPLASEKAPQKIITALFDYAADRRPKPDRLPDS